MQALRDGNSAIWLTAVDDLFARLDDSADAILRDGLSVLGVTVPNDDGDVGRDPTIPEEPHDPIAPEVLPSGELELLLQGLQSLYGDLYLRGDWVFTSRGKVVSSAEPLVAYFKYEFPADRSTRLRVDEFDGGLWIEERTGTGNAVNMPQQLPPALTADSTYVVTHAAEISTIAKTTFAENGRPTSEANKVFEWVTANPTYPSWYATGANPPSGPGSTIPFKTFLSDAARVTAAQGAPVYDSRGSLIPSTGYGSVRIPQSVFVPVSATDAGETVVDYLSDSIMQVLLGDFSGKTNALGTTAQVVLDFTPVGTLADFRDLAAAIYQNYDAYRGGTWSWSQEGAQLGLSAAGFIPGISSIRKVNKHADGAVEFVVETGGESRKLIGHADYSAPVRLIGPPVRITDEGLQHVFESHTVGGIMSVNNKSVFLPGEDINLLIQGATQAHLAPSGTLYVRWYNAGRIIGTDRNTGPTSIVSVITDLDGTLITAHPGYADLRPVPGL